MYTIGFDKIRITVVSPDECMKPILFKIRKWHHADQRANNFVSHVQNENTLAAGIESARKYSGKNIMVLLGFKDVDVINTINNQDLQYNDIIIRPPRTGIKLSGEIDEQPLASLLDSTQIINVQDTLPALSKSLLRLRFKNHITIRELVSEDDFEQYFSLRYKVWRAAGYLPKQYDCDISQWELNYTDRTAYSIGAFTSERKLIGCARLVFPIGHDTYHLQKIKKLVNKKRDTKLSTNFEYPTIMVHPFDILESMQGFRAYYRNLVIKKIYSAEVSRVIVSKEYQGNGLGEILVDSLIALARKNQIDQLFLACNNNLSSFYERCGFKKLDGLSCEHFVGVNAPAIAMALSLPKNKRQVIN